MLIVLLLAMAVLAAILLAGRNLIARTLARSWLKGQGVASSLEVRGLSLTGLKARLKLGDPAAPDLTVEEVDIHYAVNGPWNGQDLGIATQAVRLVRPEVTVHWDGHRLTYGALTRMVEDFEKRPANPNQPPPQIIIEGGTAHLATPYGVITAAGDASVEHGALKEFQGHIDPAHLIGRGGVALSTPGGPVNLTRRGQTLALQASLPVDEAHFQGLSVDGGKVSLSGALPAGGAGAITLKADINAQSLAFNGGSARNAALHWTFDGSGQAALPTIKATGHAQLQASAASLSASPGQLQTVVANLDLPNLTLDTSSGAFSGAGQGSVSAAGATAENAQARGLSAKIQIAQGNFRRGPVSAWRAQFSSTSHADRLSTQDLMLTAARIDAAGLIGSDGVNVSAALDAHGAADARRFAKTLAAVDPGYGAALQRAGRDFHVQAGGLHLTGRAGAVAITASAPIRVSSSSGASLILSPRPGVALAQTGGSSAHGAFDLALSGGGLPTLTVQASDWRASAGTISAAISARGTLNAGPAKTVQLRATGAARLTGDGFSFTLTGCEPVSVDALALGGNQVSGLAGRLCPGAGPLVQASANGWHAAGRFESVQGDLSPAGLKLSGGAGRFDLGGRDGMLNGSADLTALTAADTAATPRFQPQTAKGRLTFAGRSLAGRFTAFTPGGLDVANVSLAHDLKTGIGHADIESQALIFAKGGLQPALLTPLAAFAKDAEGPISFKGRFDWTGQGVTSQGVATTTGLTFKSPLGAVQVIKGQIRLTSLAPLVSAPDQTLTIDRIDALAPIDNLKATFDFDGQALAVDAVQANAAKGHISLEPMRIPLGGDGTVQGALVLDHVDLGDLLAASSLADSVKVRMVVIGRLPFELGPGGFHFLQGHISAVEPGRISISRQAFTGLQAGVGDVSSSGPAANAVQDLAYEALENLSFDTLEADVASRPGGRLGMIFAIRGRYDPPQKKQATFKLSELLNGTAFQKKIPLPSDTPINLNLDTSLNFDELVTALSNIWKRDTAPAASSVPVHPATP